MLTIYNDRHALHQGRFEMFRGELVPCFEVPARADFVLQELRQRRLGPVEPPQDFPGSVLTRIHSQRYLDFLAGAWEEWVALDPANAQRDAIPSYWPIRTFRSDVLPASFPARMGLFSFDAGSPLTSGTWTAARAGACCAITAAQRVLAGERAAFALTRPPGHHAGMDFFGGYCFLNNAALAAQALRDAGMERVAVLDVDYHHGNGT
jgi:acetoin utilization deacetylase AcuC-like enzyme